MAAWAESHGVNLEFIQPGKPTQNSYIERFNRTYREEVLDLYVFNSLSEVRAITEDFIREYNEERPHESLGNMSPINFAAQRAGGSPCPLGSKIYRRHIPQRFMRTFLVVLTNKVLRNGPNFAQAVEHVQIQDFLSVGPVEPLDV